jgi:hypothetical protein
MPHAQRRTLVCVRVASGISWGCVTDREAREERRPAQRSSPPDRRNEDWVPQRCAPVKNPSMLHSYASSMPGRRAAQKDSLHIQRTFQGRKREAALSPSVSLSPNANYKIIGFHMKFMKE